MDTNAALEIIIKSTRQAVHQLFETMCPLPVTDGKVVLQQDSDFVKGKFNVVGVIAVSGACKGSVSIHISKPLGEKVAKSMLGVDTLESESDLYDTIGEVTNITVGGAKTIAASSSLNFDISCPTVIRGDPYALVEPLKGSQFALLHFDIDREPLVIMVSLVQ